LTTCARSSAGTSGSPAVTSDVIANVARDNSKALLSRAKSLIYDSLRRIRVPVGHNARNSTHRTRRRYTVFATSTFLAWMPGAASIAEEFGLLVTPGNACFGTPGPKLKESVVLKGVITVLAALCQARFRLVFLPLGFEVLILCNVAGGVLSVSHRPVPSPISPGLRAFRL
jgi:hypothetical protein